MNEMNIEHTNINQDEPRWVPNAFYAAKSRAMSALCCHNVAIAKQAITFNKHKQIMITVNIQGWEKRDEL